MSAVTLSPPRPPVCLTRSYVSRGIKGGTLIAEDVTTLEEHRRRLESPDGYRLAGCHACGCPTVHAYCFRERKLRPASPDEDPLIVEIRLFRCAERSCGAVFTVLPAFVARHLWRSWETVEEVVSGKDDSPPRRTLRRWVSRLGSDAWQLIEVFTASVTGTVTRLLTTPRPATRSGFVATLSRVLRSDQGSVFAAIAGWIHRLEAGIRLM